LEKKDRGREEVHQVSEQRFFCSPWRRPWWSRLFPWSPWSIMTEQISTVQPVEEPTMELAHRSWRKLKPMETPHWSRGNMWGGSSCRMELLWTDHSPSSLPPCTAQDGGRRTKVELQENR